MNSNESLIFIFELIKALISIETIILIILIATFIPGTWLNRAVFSIVRLKLPWFEADLSFPNSHELEAEESSIVEGEAQVVGEAEVRASGTIERRTRDTVGISDRVTAEINEERYTQLKPEGARILSQYISDVDIAALRSISLATNTKVIKEWSDLMGPLMTSTEKISSLLMLFATAFVDLDHDLRLQITERGKAYLEWLENQSS